MANFGRNMAESWFGESASERNARQYEEPKSSFGFFQNAGVKSFDEHFEELCDRYKESKKIDIKRDIKGMLADPAFMEQYKTDLMQPVIEGFEAVSENDPHIRSIVENVNRFWDTKVNFYNESASMTAYLPISTLEFPVLVKQFFSSIIKDIIEVETTKTPNISKHVRTMYIVDNNTGKEYEYPKCIWDGTWKEPFNASKGLPIDNNKLVDLGTNGKLFKYDIISNLTKGVRGLDQLSFAFRINAVQVDGKRIPLVGNGITVEFATGGTLLNGKLDFTYTDATGTETVVEDNIQGQVDFREGTMDIANTSGRVTGVYIEGYLSNEQNRRSTSVREKREIKRFTIEDGARWNMPFSIEEIEDASALLDINYYNRMVDEIVRCQEMNECLTVIDFLNKDFEKNVGINPDIFKLEPVVQTHYVDLKAPAYFAGDPFQYMTRAVQFKLDSIFNQLTEATKLDNLSFIIVANPMVCRILKEFVQWRVQQGTSVGGIEVNSSYGFSTDLGANVRIVATNLFDPYTDDPVTDPANPEATPKRELVMHVYGYPTDSEHISYRHLKYTSHLFTSQSQTAYNSPAVASGGAYNIVTAMSRFTNITIQGIQARLVLLNSAIVYGNAPASKKKTGSPWPDPVQETPTSGN